MTFEQGDKRQIPEKKTLPEVTLKLIGLSDFAQTLDWMLDMDFALKWIWEFYPEVARIPQSLSKSDRQLYLEKTLRPYYETNITTIKSRLPKYQKAFNKINNEFMWALSRYFELDWPADCQKITGDISPLLPSNPRDIRSRSFVYSASVFDEMSFVKVAAHEICHFIFFEKWKTLTSNWTWRSFDYPYIIWYLSELAIDPVLNSQLIQSVIPFRFQANPDMRELEINGSLALEIIRQNFNNEPIDIAMQKSYEYLKQNRKQLEAF